MQINITLSKKEKRHYFMYLIGMLLFAVFIISLITLTRMHSPFSDADHYSVMELQGRVKFEKAQESFQKQVDSTFKKLDRMDPEKSSVTEENQIDREISDINSSFTFSEAKDGRKKSYQQVSKFYRMYFEDKKNFVDVKENIEFLNQSLEQCNVGYNGKKQLINQRRSN